MDAYQAEALNRQAIERGASLAHLIDEVNSIKDRCPSVSWAIDGVAEGWELSAAQERELRTHFGC